MSSNDNSIELLEKVKEALAAKKPMTIVGGDSKASLGHQTSKDGTSVLSVGEHTGIISYDPTELVVSVRAGTTLDALTLILSEAGQMLPFEPPALPGCTIGGVLACGLSGPRRPFSGSARDYVLGTRVINGHAQDLAFGGEVMKNVAGYDVSRIQIGAWGTLGVLLDVSMKVLPKPELEVTLRQASKPNELSAFASVMRMPLPLSGAMLIDDERYIRLSGSEAAVKAAARQLGGDTLDDNTIWQAVRDHTHAFFRSDNHSSQSLWRISVANHAPALDLSGVWLHEWGGGQRWLWTSQSADDVFRAAQDVQGHAMCYSIGDSTNSVFQPLTGTMQQLQTRVRNSFDPLRLFNPGRFHPELDAPAKSFAAGS